MKALGSEDAVLAHLMYRQDGKLDKPSDTIAKLAKLGITETTGSLREKKKEYTQQGVDFTKAAWDNLALPIAESYGSAHYRRLKEIRIRKKR